MLCSWCDLPAAFVLVGDGDLRSHDHAACEEHESLWGRLYRRSVRVRRDAAVDLRDAAGPAPALDLRDMSPVDRATG